MTIQRKPLKFFIIFLVLGLMSSVALAQNNKVSANTVPAILDQFEINSDSFLGTATSLFAVIGDQSALASVDADVKLTTSNTYRYKYRLYKSIKWTYKFCWWHWFKKPCYPASGTGHAYIC